jgi:hypothetical protein
MYLSAGNVAATGRVGLLFIDFERRIRMRVDGVATVTSDDPLLVRWPGAQLVVRVTAERIYPNCSRYIHELRLVQRSPYVPRGAAPPPVPPWKRADWAVDVLPEGDPARSGEE